MISEDEEKSITLTMDGVEKGIILGYDNGTANPKNFSITSGGIEWNDNTNNYITSLERLSAVQLAFQSIREPPNATTLVVNKVINLDNGLGNVGSIGLDTSNNLVINNVGGGRIECPLEPVSANDIVNKTFVYNTTLEDFDADTNDNTIVGTNIVFTETGSGVVLYYTGNFSSEIINGTIGRRGLLQVRSGGSAGTDAKVLSDVIYSLANIKKLTFGFIPLGTETFAAEGRTPIGNIFQILGLSAIRQTTGQTTTQSVIWRLASGSATIPTWEFVMNNVVQYTSVLGELTGKWCRVSFDITFDGVDYLVQSTLTNLTDGTTETTAVYPLTTGYEFTPNSIGLYFSTRTSDNNQKFLGVDYCELQQNLYNIGGGNTLNFR